ncbi:hypothetical protein AZA_09120 [Nitrospirillum viridazoti Y2]|nr:hypothetical protein AZA_09120 [Nitrospirillum amazonense Y2]
MSHRAGSNRGSNRVRYNSPPRYLAPELMVGLVVASMKKECKRASALIRRPFFQYYPIAP